nr:MAG TPA: Twitchin [Caudoviricetes sp.]
MGYGTSTYGPWVPSAGAAKRMRLRFDWAIGTPALGATTVPVQLIISVEAGYGFWDSSAQYSRSGALGSASTSMGVRVSTGGSTILERISGSLPIYTSGAYQVAVAASLSGVDYIGSGVTASHTSTVTLPGATSGLPGRPAPQAQYVSDTEALISWGATDLADRYYVEQWAENLQRWTRLGTVYGTSLRDYGLSPNSRYKWRVCAANGSGYESAWAETGAIRTTPSAPQLRVYREGYAVAVDLTATANYPEHWYLERSITGGAWQYWTQGDGRDGKASMTPTAGQTVQFRGKSGVSEGGQHWSQWATTITVPALQAPAAPTLLGPSGIVSVEEPVRMQWRHESRDLTDQTSAEVQWQRVGDSDWNTATVTGPTPSHETGLTVGAWQWRARTKGIHDDWSAWSAPAGFRVAAPPAATITSPTPDEVVATNRIRIHATGTEPDPAWLITAWEATLTDLTADRQVAAWSGQGPPGILTAPALAADMHQHRAAVRVRSGSGLWSRWASVDFKVDYAEPAEPVVTARYTEEEGEVVITADAQTGPVATEQIRVEVSRDAGRTWQTLDIQPGPHIVVTDPTPHLGGEVMYRVTAISELPTESTPVVVTVGTHTRRAWLLGDDGTKAHLILDMELAATHSHELVLAEYETDDAEQYPVAHYGRRRTAEVRFSGLLTPRWGSPRDVWLRLLGQRIWYRDPTGIRWRATLTATGPAITPQRGASRAVKISGTAVRISD